jgi:hypothetical protein
MTNTRREEGLEANPQLEWSRWRGSIIDARALTATVSGFDPMARVPVSGPARVKANRLVVFGSRNTGPCRRGNDTVQLSIDIGCFLELQLRLRLSV